MIHTHFSCPSEITKWSERAMERLFSEGVIVRNQGVLQNGVNNKIEDMVLLTRKVSYINIQPYYVYMHDMVPGCEHFRTTLREGVELEKPSVVPLPVLIRLLLFAIFLVGRQTPCCSYEYYDEENGISVWLAANVKPGKVFTYFDPIHKLNHEAQNVGRSPHS